MAVGPISRKPNYPQVYKKPYTPPPPPPERTNAPNPAVRTPTDQLVAPPSKELSAVVGGAAPIAAAPPPDDDFAPAALTLGVGATGPEVAALQERLVAAGFDPGPVDGIFGPLTEAGVQSFQQAAGLPTDGVASPELFAVLDALENPPAPDAPPASAPIAEAPAEIPAQAPVPGEVPPTGELPPEAQPPAFGSPEVQGNLARLPDPAQDPEVFLFAVQRATADFQNRLSNGEAAQDPQVISQDLQALATAFSAAGEAGAAQAQALSSMAQLALVPGVPATFQQELIRSFTNDGGNVGNIEKAIQSARNLEDPELTQALYATIAATVPAAIAASPESDAQALEQRGQLATLLGNPNVSPDVRRRLGQGFNGDGDFSDFTKAVEDANTKEDYTAILAFQLANAEMVQQGNGLAAPVTAEALQFLANNFDNLAEGRIFNKLENILKDPEKAFQFLQEAEDAATSEVQKALIEDFAKLFPEELIAQGVFN